MNKINKLCLVFLFSMCVIYSIETVVIKEFKMSLINSFKINDTFDLECHYELEGNETLVNVELKHENDDLLLFNKTTQDVYEFKGGDYKPKLDTKVSLLTATVQKASDKMINAYTCKIETDGKDKTADKSLKIYLWDKDVKVDEFHINSDKNKDKFEFKKDEAFSITCTVNTTLIKEYNINICHEKSIFFTYEHSSGKSHYMNNSKIHEHDFEYVNKSQLEIKTNSVKDNMKGEFSCVLELKDGEKSYLESWPKTLHVDVKGAGNLNKISFSIISITFISIFYSMFK